MPVLEMEDNGFTIVDVVIAGDGHRLLLRFQFQVHFFCSIRISQDRLDLLLGHVGLQLLQISVPEFSLAAGRS